MDGQPRLMKRVLMVAPHFPPDTGAATHRVRLLAPHLPAHGWEPVVVTVDPRYYEGRTEPELCELLPPALRVVRAPAWSARWTRRVGIGDLGLRSLTGLYRTCSALLRHERFDALFITVFPMYPALLGPLLKRRADLPFVLDYIDPWVGAWGQSVGGGPNGAPDLKSRLSRQLGVMLEPLAVHAADAITAVSAATYQQIFQRLPEAAGTPTTEIPYGGEIGDFDYLRDHPRPNRYFDPSDGNCHIVYLGTLLPLGFETLRAVLRAAAVLRADQPAVYRRLRLHFFGTSNQTAAASPPRVLPIAQELGVADCVTEVAPRIDYLDAISLQTQASATLMMGSSESHYTASKLYPGLLAKRPILAVYHSRSTVSEILERVARPPSAYLVTYDDERRAESRVADIADTLARLIEDPAYDPGAVDMTAVDDFSAHRLAGRLARLLEQVTCRPR